MADCFSLPNAAELVERLRATEKVYYEDSNLLRQDDNVVTLYESGKIAEPTIELAVEFCKKCSVGTHRCSVTTQFGWCCDLCVEEELLYLASKGVHTVNSCCGHGDTELATILVAGPESKKKMEALEYVFVRDVSAMYSEWVAKSKTIWKKYAKMEEKINDHKELIANLREESDAVKAVEWDIPICTSNHIAQAADAIEALMQENAKLKAERDAAVVDLKYSRVCYTCKHKRTPVCDGCHVNTDRWEWRGVQEATDAEK